MANQASLRARVATIRELLLPDTGNRPCFTIAQSGAVENLAALNGLHRCTDRCVHIEIEKLEPLPTSELACPERPAPPMPPAARTAAARPPPRPAPENASPPVSGLPASLQTVEIGGAYCSDGDELALDWRAADTAPPCRCGHDARVHLGFITGNPFRDGCTFRPMSIGFPGKGPCDCRAYQQQQERKAR